MYKFIFFKHIDTLFFFIFNNALKSERKKKSENYAENKIKIIYLFGLAFTV
jgi:hypothetical protein